MRTVLLLILLALSASALHGQTELSANVDRSSGALAIDLGTLLEDAGLRQAIHSGLPLRIEVRSELWRDGFFDSQEGGELWRASVVHDPVRRSYEIEVPGSGPTRVETLAEAARILADNFGIALRPSRRARYYYLTTIEVETLSLSDLEELRQWLRGDVAPAVQGRTDGESAVATGVRRMVVRALGLPTFRRRLRTEAFNWDGGV